MSILFGSKIDTYRRRGNIILQVSPGPGGWSYATWSICEKGQRYELSVYCNEHGSTRLGSLSVAESEYDIHTAAGLDKLLQAPRSLQWHHSGQAIAVAEAGRLYLFSVDWMSSAGGTKRSPISLSQASRIFCVHLEEEGQQEKEGAETAPGSTLLAVDVVLRKRSIHIGASAVCVANAGLRGLERMLEEHRGQGEKSALPGVLLVGTGLGAVLAFGWNWRDGPREVVHADGQDEHGSSESLEEAAAALPVRMTALVVLAADGAYGEDRALLRPWQENSFAPAEGSPRSPALGWLGAEVLDVGDSLEDATEKHPGAGVGTDAAVPRSGLGSALDGALSGAGTVKSMSFDDREGVFVVLYSDGSFRASILTADSEKDANAANAVLDPERAAVAVRVQQSPRIHPVLLVAYPLSAPEATSSSNAGPQHSGEKLPGVYEMGVSGAYRSSDFVTARDVQQLLDLPPALLAKVSRMRKLVTGRAEEEIGRCVGLRVVSSGEGAVQVLCMVHTRHLPALTYASPATPAENAESAAEGGDSVLGPRSESFTLMLLNLRSAAQCPPDLSAACTSVDCLQVACVEKLAPPSEETERRRWTGAGTGAASGCASSLMELILLPGASSALALVLHSCGLLTVRSVANLQAVVLSLQCTGTQLPDAGLSTPRIVCCAVGAGTLVLSAWSAVASEVGCQKPSMSGSLLSHIPLLTSLRHGCAAGQGESAFLDLSSGAFVRLECEDGEAVAKEGGGKRAARAEGFDLSDAHHLAPTQWSLPLPRRLLGEVWRHRAACVASASLLPRRFHRPVQEGLLFDSSQPSYAGADSTQYLAFIAGGAMVPQAAPPSSSSSADSASKDTRALWIYNCRTCRWRAVSLTAGNEGSAAHVLRNVPWVASPRISGHEVASSVTAPLAISAGSPERKDLRRRSENDVTAKVPAASPAVRELAVNPPVSQQPAEKRVPALSLASIATALASQVSSGKEQAEKDGKSTLVRISAKSQLAGPPSAVLRVAWCGRNTLVLLTLRRSTFCMEVVSREASKGSLSAGKPQPAVHRIVMLPPGYSPADMWTVPLDPAVSQDDEISIANAVPADPRSSPRKDSRRPSGSIFSTVSTAPGASDLCDDPSTAYAVVVSDGSHVFCYHLSVHLSRPQEPSAAENRAATTSARVSDYTLCVLWEVGLAGLPCSADFLAPCDDRELGGNGIKFPAKVVIPFIQRSSWQAGQDDGFRNLRRAAAKDPLLAVAVNLLVLDSAGSVWYVDADLRRCALVSRGPVSSIAALDLRLPAELSPNGSAATSPAHHPLDLSHRQPALERAFLLSYTQERSSQAQSRLLYVFRKTSLIQHLRTSAADAVVRASFQRSMLWLPTRWLGGDPHLVPTDTFRVPSSEDLATHPFSDADVAGETETDAVRAPVHSVAALSLPPLPPGHQLMCISADGVCQCVSRSHLDFSGGESCVAVKTPTTLCLSSTMSAAFAAVFECDASALQVDAVGLSEDAAADAARRLSQHLALAAFRSLRATPRSTALLISQLESLVRSWCEQAGFSHEHTAYRRLTGFLATADPSFLCELLSRLGRKLEPAVGRLLFPAEIAAQVPPVAGDPGSAPARVNVVVLFQRSLRLRQLHHAARMLSLACEAVGGSESHISTAASLFMALELLSVSARNCSLRCVAECFEFCVRLEDMLALHAKAIFGDAPDPGTVRHHSLDSSYVKTVKSRAAALIEAHSVGGSTNGAPAQTITESEPVFDSLTAASPALPFYLGIGVGWVLDKAAQSIFPGARSSGQAQTISPSPRVNPRKADSASAPRLSIRTSSAHGFLSGAEDGPPGSLCGVINQIEAQYGAVQLSEMLSRTSDTLHHITTTAAEHFNDSDHSLQHPGVPGPTILALVLVLKAMFDHSSHYCNAAVLMMALMQLPAARAMICRFITWECKVSPAHASRTIAANARDKVRRILYVFHLNKAISKDQGTASSILSQRICGQYLRRVVEADRMQFVPSTPSLRTLTESPRSAKENAPPQRGQADYFELTEDLLRRASVPRAAHPEQAELSAGETSASGATDFVLLDLVKALALSLVFTRDFATAGLLLLTLEPHLSAVDPALHAALRGLPTPCTVAAAAAAEGAEVDGASDGAAVAEESGEDERMVWDVTEQQLAAISGALCGVA